MLKGKRSSASAAGVNITDDVITAIAVKEAEAVEGVAGLAACPGKGVFSSGKPGKKARSVLVDSEGDELSLHVCLKVNRSRPIPDTAAEVRECVTAAVEGITGRVVTDVDITVAEIDLS